MMTAMMTLEQEFAWLVGILEGEGTFVINRVKGRKEVKMSVKIAMSDLDVIERAQRAFPGSTENVHKPKLIPGSKQMYSITWNGAAARDLMWAVQPFMGARRSDRILTNLADWYESRMRVCLECETEFTMPFSRTGNASVTCGDKCGDARLGRKVREAQARYYAKTKEKT